MSQISAEIIINDFDNLKQMFSNLDEKHIWEVFSSLDFNFNKSLERLLQEENSNLKEESNLEEENKNNLKSNETRKPFNVMETLRNLYNNKKKSDSTFNYHQLD